MSFREFTANILSTRDYKVTPVEENLIAEITAYLREINAGMGNEKGFSFVVLQNGEKVFHELEGIGGYNGVMIKSPHYIALNTSKEDPEVEFYGAYYMQSIVKKLYEMNLGSCWINVRKAAPEKKSELVKNQEGSINYLLAFGVADEKAAKQNAPKMAVTHEDASYKQNPYGTKVTEIVASDKARHGVEEIVYLYEWGNKVTYDELERRGVAEIFLYVRNAPSYKNIQPCRLILKDGEADLAILSPVEQGSFTDAGIMMYTLEGLAKEFGIPSQWKFIKEVSEHKEYQLVANISL